jgi:predicted TIM-barrel fold metal-dependent hydrolase
MQITHGLMSCDSHGQLDRDAFTSRMSASRWGDRIPRVIELEDNGRKVERWTVDGRVQGGGVVNCPAVMHERQYYPKRWEEVPPKVYDPAERTRALDEDGIDAKVLFPNTPVQGLSFAFGDPEYEVACVEAYNDALGAWAEVSDRYIPLALLPYLSPIEVVIAQVERAVKHGHRGICMLAEPSLAVKGGKSLRDPYWDPLWDTCQELGIPINWHGSAGVGGTLSVPRWKGYSERQYHTVSTGRNCMTACQLLPYLFFSGILDRYPRLTFACAETGAGWITSILEGCDHEWERRHLWTEGILTRPSEAFRRQVYVDFWFEQSGIALRHLIGVDNIMWESDYPHITSTYPNSWEHVERSLTGVPEDERKKLLYGNLMRLYKLS